jgi:hypothetical protein
MIEHEQAIAEVKKALEAKEKEITNEGDSVISFTLEAFNKIRQAVASFEQRLTMPAVDGNPKPTAIAGYKNEAQNLLIEISLIKVK